MGKIRKVVPGWLLAVLVIAANLVLAGIMYQDVEARDSPCSTPGHCHCVDVGFGPYCSHVLGSSVECTGPGTC